MFVSPDALFFSKYIKSCIWNIFPKEIQIPAGLLFIPFYPHLLEHIQNHLTNSNLFSKNVIWKRNIFLFSVNNPSLSTSLFTSNEHLFSSFILKKIWICVETTFLINQKIQIHSKRFFGYLTNSWKKYVLKVFLM